MKQVEVTIMGHGYILGCPEGGEALLATAVASVDREMSAIRDGGKVKARERIAVLAALNVAFGEPTMAVDTHIFRVANRTGLASGKSPREVEDGLLARVPGRFMVDAHHWLILHGRYVCVARQPRCADCRVQAHCDHGRHLIPAG